MPATWDPPWLLLPGQEQNLEPLTAAGRTGHLGRIAFPLLTTQLPPNIIPAFRQRHPAAREEETSTAKESTRLAPGLTPGCLRHPGKKPHEDMLPETDLTLSSCRWGHVFLLLPWWQWTGQGLPRQLCVGLARLPLLLLITYPQTDRWHGLCAVVCAACPRQKF